MSPYRYLSIPIAALTHPRSAPAASRGAPQRSSRAASHSAANPLPAEGTLTLTLAERTETFLLPPLPCSSLCLCPVNFSHCWQSPALELQKSAGGAFLQSCRLPVPVWMPYIFTPPEQPTCIIVHILSLPSSALNKKGKILFEKWCSQGLPSKEEKKKSTKQSKLQTQARQSKQRISKAQQSREFHMLRVMSGKSVSLEHPAIPLSPRSTVGDNSISVLPKNCHGNQGKPGLSGPAPRSPQAPALAAAAACAFASHPIAQEPAEHPQTPPRAR